MRNLVVCLLLNILVLSSLWAQEYQKCGTMPGFNEKLENSSEFSKRVSDIEEHTAAFVEANEGKEKMDALVTIPVVVHVLYRNSNPATNITEAKIMSQIDRLNADYRRTNDDADETRDQFLSIAADSEIEFCLATRDPDGFPTTGITRTQTTLDFFYTSGSGAPSDNAKDSEAGGKDGWPSDQYLNMWVVEEICSDSAFEGFTCGVLGYAQFPGDSPDTDGVVIVYNAFGEISPLLFGYNRGRTTTHEVGHWLNLRHVWGDGPCAVDDFVSDTPYSDEANYGCPIFENSCTDSPNDLFDNIENYMDYTNDDCQNMYTSGQKLRMQSLFAPGGERNSLLSSQGCDFVEIGTNDVWLVDIANLSGASNCSYFNPIIEVMNYGSEQLFYFTVEYSVNDGPIQSSFWTGELNSFDVVEIELPGISTNGGGIIHDLNVSIANPNGLEDFDAGNNNVQITFATIPAGDQAPIIEDFEGSFPPSDWEVSGGGFTNNSDASHTGSTSAFVAQGETGVHDLILPDLDLGNIEDGAFSFWVAHAQSTAAGAGDRLDLMLSKDCGATYESIWSKTASNLATAGVTSSSFVPTASDWREEVVDLWDYKGLRNASLAFRVTKGDGNNIYIDDLNVMETVGIDDDNSIFSSGIQLFPNPTIGNTNLVFDLESSSNLNIEVVDLSGKLIDQLSFNGSAGYNSISLNSETYSSGIYFVKISSKSGTLSKQLVVLP